jgi:hypothetical protein
MSESKSTNARRSNHIVGHSHAIDLGPPQKAWLHCDDENLRLRQLGVNRAGEPLELNRNVFRRPPAADVVVSRIHHDEPGLVWDHDAVDVTRRVGHLGPPNPRLMIVRSGKYAVVSHLRIVELPTKTI